MHLATHEYILRLGFAFVLGGAIGLERERHPRPAGFRTHTLVALGSALAILVSTYGFADVVGSRGMVLDPSRVAAQVISGIGFIGAGTIIAGPDRIRGLTTAASLWAAATIGLAAGGGLYVPAAVTTAFVLLALVPLNYIETRIFHR